MELNTKLLEQISKEASVSPRLRMNYDLRNTPTDHSQRMLNAIEPGTELPVHRHSATSEVCIVVRGIAEEIFYDDNGNITERVIMKPDSQCFGVVIEPGRWHKIVSLETGTVIFEAKDGLYEPLSSNDILEL